MKKPKKRTRRKRKNVKAVLVIGHILLWGWISQILCLFSIQTAEVSLLKCTFLNLFSHTIYLCFNYLGSKMNRSDFGIQIYRAGTSIVQHFCQTVNLRVEFAAAIPNLLLRDLGQCIQMSHGPFELMVLPTQNSNLHLHFLHMI